MKRAPPLTPEALRREYPECEPWLALLDEARRALADPRWTSVGPITAGTGVDGFDSTAPRLDGAVLEVDGPAADRLVRRLLAMAAHESGPTSLHEGARNESLHAPALLEAAVCQDARRLDGWASRLAVPAPVLRAVASVAVVPLLHACRRAAGEVLAPGWTRGYCPVCGAWPALAEARGLERSRWLRCARCGGGWRIDWLRCPYCDNSDHATLGALVGEAMLETRTIDTCRMCRGYLKTLTMLHPTPADAVALVDMATVDLDIAALERGYQRPVEPAHGLSVRLVAATP
jgi:FdhE protein